MEKLSIICPVFNEEDVIKIFYDELKKTLNKLRKSYKSNIIFVLDKSSDNSFDILKNICEKDKSSSLIMLSKRFGHQASLLVGLDHCKGDIIIMMDSDMQHPPSLIPKMLSAYNDGFEVVYTIRTDDKDKSFIRSFFSKKFYLFLNFFSEINLNPGEADFRLISKRVKDIFKEHIREQNPFFRGLFSWVGFNRIGIKFSAHPRAKGESKYNSSRLIKFAFLGLVSFGKRPLQLAIYFGILLSILSFLFMFYILVTYLFGKMMPSGWVSLALLISFFGGVQLVFIGLIGEYIGQIYDQVKGRPHYIVERKINID